MLTAELLLKVARSIVKIDEGNFFFKAHNCSLGFYMSELYASWKMTYLGVEPAKLVPESHAPTTRLTLFLRARYAGD